MPKDISIQGVEYNPFADEEELSLVVPSTEPQREIWSSVQMSKKASCAFNESITLEFDGRIDRQALSSALEYLIKRHDSLRTTFTPDGSSLCISDAINLVVTEISGNEKDYKLAVLKEADTAFDLENGPLIRFILVTEGEDKAWLILSAHHIICDGWSLAILVNDLEKAYNAARINQEPEQAAAYPYSQYAKEYSEQIHQSDDKKFWTDLFAGSLTTVDLPADFERPAFRSFDADRIDYQINPELITAVKKLAGKQGVSLTALMLTAYYTCLYKWSGEQDLVVGLPAANQPQYDSESLVGHCVNFLPLRIRLDADQEFRTTLSNVSDLILDAYEHQNFTYGSLLKSLPIKRDPSRIPLCPVSFNVDQGIQGSKLKFQGLDVHFHSNPRAYENFEMFINASDYGDKFIIECQYNTNIFSESSMLNRLDEYCMVLSQLTDDVQLKLSDIRLLSDDTCAVLLQRHSNTQDFGRFTSLPELFDRQATISPEKDAISCDGETLSYHQLAQRSNQVASYLISNGVIPGTLIGICLDRSIELPAVLLGVLKAGAGYVPLDPEYPSDRLNYMLEDANLQYLISQDIYVDRLSDVEHTLLIDDLLSNSDKSTNETPELTISGESVCYVIYTSGSTGKPKGVMVPHSSVSNFLQSMVQTPGITGSDTLLAVTTLSFDIAVLELYLPIISGAKVVIATRDQVIDGNRLKDLIAQNHVSIMQATPATWRLLCNADWQGGKEFKILCGGEALPRDLCSDLLSRSGQLWNMYGPTETTVWSTCHMISDADNPPLIGKAIANTNLYVLDEFYNLVPDGIPGELYIGGDGVTLGYLNRESLTQERFLQLEIAGDDRLYRTGDKVRFNIDGNLEYLGRLDNQIKLRGFRIELGEIETAIRQHDSVKDCALSVQKISAEDERLIGYIVASGETVDFKQIRDFLSETLPAYMIPLHFMLISTLPRTPNGKLDRNALPEFDFSGIEKKAVKEARTPSERLLASIWKDVLKLNTVNIEDNFFDLGGHSLLIAKIIQKLEQAESVQLEYRDIFDNPTIESLASYLDSKAGNDNSHLASPIVAREKSQQSALSPAQQRLWYLDKMDPGSTHFNLPSAFKFIGKLDIPALELAFQQMINRHEVFRTSIIELEDNPVQHIADSINFTLAVTSIPAVTDQQELLADKLDLLQRTTFDISQAPLFKVELITLNDYENVLFFMPHHLIFDGWSFDVFVHELTTLYSINTGVEIEPLTDLPIQYTDYAAWLRDLLSSNELDHQLEYWKEHLAGNLPVLQMPIDYPRPEIATNKGAEIHFQIDESLFTSLESLARSKEVSVFMLLMSSYLSLLYRYTGQTDLIVGAPMADRTRPGTENLIGFFVNALVLRFNINPQQSFTELLEHVKEVCLSGFANQDAPFETLVEQLNPERDLSRAPLFQTSVTYQDVTSREISMGDIDIQQVEIPTIEAPLDVNIWFKRRGNKVLGAVVYSTDLFHADSIHRLVDNFQNILRSIAHNWHQPVARLELLSKPDITALKAFNNNTEKHWEPSSSIQMLIEKQVTKSPGDVAATCGTQTMSYLELSQRSNQLARYLIQQGVQPGQMIGLCVDRSLDMLVSLLGILKTGCCYIPLDPEFPQERLAYMVKDAGLDWMITQDQFSSVLPEVNTTVLLDDITQLLEGISIETVDCQIDPESLAYVIYTSGSTGNPKGVMVQHSAVINFLQSMSETPGLTAQDKLLAVTTLSFDIAVLELYLPLIVGATTVIASKMDVIDGRRLLDLIKNHGITAMQATPATWRMLIAAGWDEQHQLKALCGGEALPGDLAGQLVTRSSALWNMYGPTETTVWSTCSLVEDANQPLSIGTPIANTRLYILDDNMNPVPQGVAGELYISGEGVTKGYLNNADMTNSKFIENGIEPVGRLYRTGDSVRYRIDGSLEYIGRIDHQVKVRGYRIELGEIESVLREHDSISDCIVSVIEERSGDARLVAYIVWQSSPVTMTELRSYCKKWLPAYMIPQHTVDIDEMPKTPNGKVDRKKLPDVFSNLAQQDSFVAPDTQEQIWLADIWEQLIGTSKIGKHDNFFDLGGHSLLSMQIIHKIESETGVVLNPRDILLETLEQIASKFELPAEDISKSNSNTGILGRIFNRKRN
jgi:amino acid adenylation domain-containing protein